MSIELSIPDLWLLQNLTSKIKGQGHGWKSQHGSNIQSTHILFVLCQLGIPFLSYNVFKIWPWNSRVKGMGEVIVQSHNVSYILSTHIPFFHCQSGIRFLSHDFFQIWPWKIKDQVHGCGHSSKSQCASNILSTHIPGSWSNEQDVAHYRSRHFHRTLIGINRSSSFRDMGSAKSGPSAAWFDKFLANGQDQMENMG